MVVPAMDETTGLSFDDLAGEAAVLGVYRQVFAVLARESGAMILDSASIDVDEAVLGSFAEAGPEGLTVDQVVIACGRYPDTQVRRRFEVLREYRAVERVKDRPHELYHRAAFAPYVMLLFLRRIADRGGQAELHQLLTLEHLSVREEGATVEDARGTTHRLSTVFRLLANQLAGLAVGGVVETLRENAQLLWGNHGLLDQANDVHQTVLTRWSELDRECRGLRLAIAAYRDAVDAAAGRLIEQAGATRALGLLPVEAWRTFAREAEVGPLSDVLNDFLFDAPAPWFAADTLIEAVESAQHTTPVRITPPRPQTEPGSVLEVVPDAEAERLRSLAEQLLGERTQVSVAELVDEIGDWLGGRRLLADLTAMHLHDTLPYELRWSDRLRIDVDRSLSWMTEGRFARVPMKALDEAE
jgi:hypothetical protein